MVGGGRRDPRVLKCGSRGQMEPCLRRTGPVAAGLEEGRQPLEEARKATKVNSPLEPSAAT